ncbi:MAG: hypothetical protein CMK09_03360 [Ponticaulis sp.]|nr:hypothetical protein [Ponticaulis sp.]|tara:strand:- start:9629 stop:10330 length:702 start_codon:yes stop_codon:yes gene_type:complete
MFDLRCVLALLPALLLLGCTPQSPRDAAYDLILQNSDLSPELRQAIELQRDRPPQDGNQGPLLPLEVTPISEVTIEEADETRYVHSVSVGNWSVKCWYTRRASSTRREVMCDVAPWIGGSIGEFPFATVIGGSVQFSSRRDPQLTIKSPQREANSEWSFACGSKRWSGQSERSRDTMLYDRDAAAFIQVMKTRDCVVSYTPKNGETRDVTMLKHGFREAYSYAQRYMTSPKMG